MKTDSSVFVEKRSVTRRAVFAFPFFLALGLLWTGYLSDKAQPPRDAPQQVSETVIPSRTVVAFENFLIPIEGKPRHSLISLSFALQVPNGIAGREIEERMSEIRGFIYDTLREDFEGSEGIPSLLQAKNGISRAVGLVFPGLRVDDVFISRFLAL